MSDPWRDPTATGAVYADPTAPVFIALTVLPEPDPVYRDDALFASASANWRPTPVPLPPVPVLDESGELVLVPAAPPTPAILRDEAVAALKAPPARDQPPASRGGARSTYAADPPPRGSRRSAPARPAGAVTTSPSTWLPSSGPTPTAAWRPQPGLPTWLPQQSGQPQPGPPQGRGQLPPAQPQRGRPQAQQPSTWPAGPGAARGRGSGKGWIPGLFVLGFIVLANVLPHLNGVLHRGTPSGVDKTVNSYYSLLENGQGPQAVALICTSDRADWLRPGPASDLSRSITDHTITSTRSAGKDTYTVNVAVTATNPGPASITVVRESGTYRICGGTGS